MALRNTLEPTHRAFAVDHDLRLALGERGTLLTFLLGSAVVAATLVSALEIASRLAQTSDSAQGFVEGHAIVRGNVLLSGWHLPIDNYYFTDTIPYAALEWIIGPQPILLALIPAVTYALFVCAGLVVCLKAAQSLARKLEAAAAATLMLAPSGWIGSWNPLLMSNMHFATVVGALVALALCAGIARSEPDATLARSCAGLALVTSATVASDPFSLVFAFGPALAVLSADALLYRPDRNERTVLFVLAGATLVGVLSPFFIALIGGFATDNNVVAEFVSPSHLGRNVSAAAGGLLRLSGASPFSGDLSWRAIAFITLRGPVLVIAIAAVLFAVRGLFGGNRASLLDRLLCAGALSVLAACLLSTQFGKGIGANNPWGGGPPMRYLMPVVMFAAIMGARRIPEMLSAFKGERAQTVARGALVFFAALALCAGTFQTLGDRSRWIVSNPPVAAARWLAQRGLTTGDADYWSANLVTVMSGETLDLRSVVPQEGRVVPYALSADTLEHGNRPQFVIWQDGTQSGMTFADVKATYPICRVDVVAGYRIALLADRERSCPQNSSVNHRARST